MPTEVEIPDVGIVEFPDAMSEQDIASEVGKLTGPRQSANLSRYAEPSRGGYATEIARGLTQFVPALTKTTSTVGDKLGNIVRAGVGLDPLPETLAPPEERPLYKAAKWMQDKLDAAYPAVPEPQRNIGHDVATGLGQMASMVAGGMAARGAGATLKGAALVGTALGFGQEFDDAFTRARQRGDDPDTALYKSLGYATLAAMIENKLGAGRIIKKYFPDPAEAAKKLSAWGVSKATAISLAVGFGEEGSQRFAQNWIVEGKPSLEGIVQEGAPGGIVQAIAELPAHLLRGPGRARRALRLPQPPATAIEPEVSRQKLWENMQGREMDIPLDQWEQPASPHLKMVLGDNAPSWRDLNFQGVVTANKNPDGSYRVKLITRAAQETPVAPAPTAALPQGGRADATEVATSQAKALQQIAEASGDVSWIQGVSGGTFAGTSGGLNIDSDGNVILTRRADSEDGILKGGKTTSAEEMQSVISGGGTFGGTQVPTSAKTGWAESGHYGEGYTATFKIPLTILLALIKQGRVGLANISAGEIVLSGDVAAEFLDSIASNQAPVATGIADELNQLRAIANPTPEQQARIAQIEAQDKGKVQRAEWESQMKADLEKSKAASENALPGSAAGVGVPAPVSGGTAPATAALAAEAKTDGSVTRVTYRNADGKEVGYGQLDGNIINMVSVGDAYRRKGVGAAIIRDLKERGGLYGVAGTPEGLALMRSKAVGAREYEPNKFTFEPATQPETKPAAPVETVRQENLRKQALAEVERQIAASAGEKSVGSFVADVKDSTGSWMKETVSVLSISDPVKLSRPSSDGGWQVSFEAPSTLGKTGRQTRTRNFFKKADALVWIDEVKRGKPAPAPASDVSPKQPRQPTTLQQLDELVIQHGLETGRIDDLETLHAPKITETSSLGSMGLAAKRKYSEQIKTARERIASDLGIAKDNLETSEGRTELLAKLKERIESTSKLVEVALSDMPEGSDFTVHGEKFTVKDTNEETGIVTLKDGRTLKVNERASVKIDPGSLQAKEATFDPEAENPVVSKGGELGGEIGQTFNLVGEKTKFVEPTKETTAFGDETLSQNDLFQIEQVTKEVDPFKSADAAQKMYGGAAEAAAIVERQLRTLDQNPEFKKQFDKKQRARLTEVLNLLRERATAAPEANIAERAIAGIEDLQKKLRGSGSDVSMGVPKAILDLALEVARLSLKAGNTIYQAIDAAIAKIREQLGETPFDEAQVREVVRQELEPTEGSTVDPATGERMVSTQVQGTPVGIEREAENIAATQQTIRASIFDGTQTVSDAATAAARALFDRMTDPNQKATAVGEILTTTNAQMGPGLVLSELWRYAERMVLSNGDDSFLRHIVPHYQDFALGESGAGATAFGRGLRALQETDSLFRQLYEIEQERRTAAGQQMAVGPELLETLLAALRGETDATVLERKTRTALGTKVKPEKVEAIVRVVRKNPVDPVEALINHFAKLAGIDPVKPEQHKRLVELARKLTDPNLSTPERSELVDQMFSVFSTMRLPPSLLTRLASNLVVTNLTGLPTAGINIFAPLVQNLFDLTYAGISSPMDFPPMLKAMLNSGRTWLSQMRFSLGRDAYSFLNNDFQRSQDILKTIWERGLRQIKSNNTAERTKGATNMLFGAQQYFMRFLTALDNANGMMKRQSQLALYTSSAMRHLKFTTSEIRDTVDMLYLMKEQFYAMGIEAGLSHNVATVRADDLAVRHYRDFIENKLDETGSEIFRSAELDTYSQLGRLGPGIEESKEGGLVSRTLGIPILKLSNWMRQQPGLTPALGVALLGYVNVPYRAGRFLAWNSPYGLLRLGINKWRKSTNRSNWWQQSLATEQQERYRFKQALAGTAVMALVTSLGLALKKTSADEEDEDGIYFTGEGPKNRQLRSAWMARGFKPYSMVIVAGKLRTAVPMNRSGEALAHIAWILSARDQKAWRDKEAAANGRTIEPSISKEAAHGIGAYLGLLGHRGFLQTVFQVGQVTAGAEDPRRFAASKGAAFTAGLVTPFLGLQRSVVNLLTGTPDTSSISAAVTANAPVLALVGDTFRKPLLNRLGDPLYNPENSWYHKLYYTGIPIAVSVTDSTANQKIYGLMVEKGAAPPSLRRGALEEKYGPLNNDQFRQFAQTSGRQIKQQLINNEPMLRNMTPEGVKKWISKAATDADKITAIGLGLEPVKPSRSSASAPVISLPADSPLPRSTVPRASTGRARAAVGRLPVTRVSSGRARSRIRLASMKLPRLSTGRARRGVRTRIGRVTGRARSRVTRSFRPPRTRRPRFAFQMI